MSRAANVETWTSPLLRCRACGSESVQVTDQRLPGVLHRHAWCLACDQRKTYVQDQGR